jgi:hypothetical protein
MDEQLTKSLTDLIDETLSELEELRKSKMSAAEIKMEGPGEDGIAGKPSNGDLHAAKAEEEAEDEDDEEEAEKADYTKDPADSEEIKRKLKGIKESKKSEGEEQDEDEEDEDEEVEKSWQMSKKEKKEKKEPHHDDPEHEEKEKKIAKKLLDMHKSTEEVSTLMKSYVEERIQPLEQKLETILELVNSIAEQPVAPKGVTIKTAPLLKSADSGYSETLSKAQIANKLFELKKSGTRVDSLDIAKAEMGQDLVNIVKKYEIS